MSCIIDSMCACVFGLSVASLSLLACGRFLNVFVPCGFGIASCLLVAGVDETDHDILSLRSVSWPCGPVERMTCSAGDMGARVFGSPDYASFISKFSDLWTPEVYRSRRRIEVEP